MQRLLSIALSCLFAVSLSAQEPSITYPYNPDSNTDSLIGASDLVDFLPFYGEEFTPEPLTIEGMSVEEWMEQQSSSSGGGCDYEYPQGINGELVNFELVAPDFTNTTFNVPVGKNLYVTHFYHGSSSDLRINEIPIFLGSNFGNDNDYTGSKFSCIVGSNQSIWSSSNGASFSGILIDEADVQPITFDLNESSFVVPAGKQLIILSLYNRSNSNNILVNNIIIAQGNVNHQPSSANYYKLSNTELILKSGDVIQGVGGYNCSFNGYLVDEDYFADCGGGGGSGDDESVITVSFPDDDETPNTISITDYSRYIYVESPSVCADCYHLYLESSEGLSNGLKTMVINQTGETIYIHNDFDFHGASFGTARDYVIVNEQFYLVH